MEKTNGAWKIGSGNGGLDTGDIKNQQTFYVHAIKESKPWWKFWRKARVTSLFTDKEGNPVMPKGYNKSRLIGVIE